MIKELDLNNYQKSGSCREENHFIRKSYALSISTQDVVRESGTGLMEPAAIYPEMNLSRVVQAKYIKHCLFRLNCPLTVLSYTRDLRDILITTTTSCAIRGLAGRYRPACTSLWRDINRNGRG